jgi:ribonuclease VapC
MIAIDSSAIIALMRSEPKAEAIAQRLASEEVGERLLSVASYLEIGSVLADARTSDRMDVIADLDAYLDALGITLVAVDGPQAGLALKARIEHGRGIGHGGVLNFGDCFAYALARSLGASLLFVGDDFTRTDIEGALG